MVGVNGSGKTTTCAKLAHTAIQQGRQPLLAATDTFRAAGADQLKLWAKDVGCDVVAGAPGADAAAVAYDALDAAVARGRDLVIVDTAGRMHTKEPLMKELQKVRGAMAKRVSGAPHETWIVLDATLGQNAVMQAKVFHEAVALTGVIISKLDGSSKAGFVFSINREMGIPIRFVGLGEKMDELVPFEPEKFVGALMNSERLDAEGMKRIKPLQPHEFWMQRALRLARRGEGLTRPNPPVGAVAVKSGKIVGEGYHRRAGGPHAEVVALSKAGTKARGCTLYVTLEPCCTWGRTPPCTDLILSSGVRRVVVSVRDPNPRHSGRGLTLLRRKGIRVIEGVCAEEGMKLIAPFAKWIRRGLPYVTLKLGMSVDGKIADRKGRSRWITGPEARNKVHELRRRVDGILVGGGTVRNDDPSPAPAA